MRKNKLIVLKIGGSIITDKSSEEPKLQEINLSRITQEISLGINGKSLALVHGVGSFGHPIVQRTGINLGIKEATQLLAFAETQRQTNQLNTSVCNALVKEGVPATPVQASSSAVMKNGVLQSLDCAAIRGFLSIGLVPVLYGTPAYDQTMKCSILSGDQIVAYLSRELCPSEIIFATDVDGVFNSDPKLNKDAVLLSELKEEDFDRIKLTTSQHWDVTGGMLGKVLSLKGHAHIECQIINGLIPGRIKDALLGKKVLGTRIRI